MYQDGQSELVELSENGYHWLPLYKENILKVFKKVLKEIEWKRTIPGLYKYFKREIESLGEGLGKE